MPVIYILKLKQGKYYIGKSTNPVNRIEQHRLGEGSEWTKLYEPKEIIDSINQTINFTELATTLEYMKKYGIENVRGASYCTVKLTDLQKSEIENHIRGEYDLCFICGEDTHFSNTCPRQSNKYPFLCKYLYKLFCCVKRNPILEYDDDTYIISFGKYKGFTYEQIYEKDQGYCKWVINTHSKNEEFRKFKTWLRNK